MKLRILFTTTFLMAISAISMAEDAYGVYKNGTLTFYFDDNMSSWQGDVYEWNESYTILDKPKWVRSHSTDIIRVIFHKTFKRALPKTMRHCFDGCINLATIEGLDNICTSEVTEMQSLFSHCELLEGELDLSHWDTSKVTDMSNMFYCCQKLGNVIMSSWNTGNVTNMSGLFSWCEKLEGLDIGKWDTHNVEDMSYMFCFCPGLTQVEVNKWTTNKVTNMARMFAMCKSLTSLDLENWDTYNVTDMYEMFFGCEKLSKIYCGKKWTTTGVLTFGEHSAATMFKQCYKLVGGMGTKYNSSYVDPSYAHYDDGPANPGYMSDHESCNIAIKGTRVTLSNYQNLPYQEMSYDPTTNTLTFNNLNAQYTNGDYNLIYIYGRKSNELKIVVNGTCTLEGKKTPLYVNNSLVTISGPGKLELKSTNLAAIYVVDSYKLTLLDADVKATGYSCAIVGSGSSSEMEVNHSTLFATSSNFREPTINNLGKLTLVNAKFDDINVVDYYWYIYYGDGFNYDNENHVLRFDGTVLNDDSGETFEDHLVWCNHFGISPIGNGISTGGVDRLNDNGKMMNDKARDEWYTIDGLILNGKPKAKGIYINNGRKVVLK